LDFPALIAHALRRQGSGQKWQHISYIISATFVHAMCRVSFSKRNTMFGFSIAMTPQANIMVSFFKSLIERECSGFSVRSYSEPQHYDFFLFSKTY